MFLAAPFVLLLLASFLRSQDVLTTPRATLERVLHYEGHVREYAARSALDPALVSAVIAVESRGRPRARSPRGAVGLMQLMPATAEEVAGRRVDRTDPETSIGLGTRYLARMIRTHRDKPRAEELGLAAYNAGPGNVARWLREDPSRAERDPREWVPFKETRDYLRRVSEWRTRFTPVLTLD